MSKLEVLWVPAKRRGKSIGGGTLILLEVESLLPLAEIKPGPGIETADLWSLLTTMVRDHNALMRANPARASQIADEARMIRDAMEAKP